MQVMTYKKIIAITFIQCNTRPLYYTFIRTCWHWRSSFFSFGAFPIGIFDSLEIVFTEASHEVLFVFFNVCVMTQSQTQLFSGSTLIMFPSVSRNETYHGNKLSSQSYPPAQTWWHILFSDCSLALCHFPCSNCLYCEAVPYLIHHILFYHLIIDLSYKIINAKMEHFISQQVDGSLMYPR